MPVTLWALLQLVWGAEEPQVKAWALTQLKALEVKEAGRPMIEMLIKAAEDMLANLP